MKRDSYSLSLKLYLVFTFLLTYGIGYVIYHLGGMEKYPVFSILIMFVPAIVAISVTVMVEREKGLSTLLKSLGFRFGKVKHIIIYPMIIFSIIILTYLVTYPIAPEVFISTSELLKVLSELSIEFGSLPVSIQVLVIFFMNCVVGTIINIPLFLGEEIGWRAFLYPRLENIYGKRGLIIGGMIWGVWHAPMILMGHNYPSFPFLGLFVMTLFCIPVGIILYYFYRQSGSIITVALCHGILNQTAATFHMIFVDNETIQPIIHGPTGIIGIVIFALIAFIFYRKYWHRSKQSQPLNQTKQRGT